MNYYCKCCNYHTFIKANYNKHLLSQKHVLKNENANIKCNKIIDISKIQNIKNKNETSNYTCKYCETNFTFKQSMYRHIKHSCNNKKGYLYDLIKNINNKLDIQNVQIQKQFKQIDILMSI